ncbi:MAG: hypothetical protein Q7S27_07255 [Nanoarchaeota archaeon]|nr:hypothetical protein [Nanoarchaeota archaeon]
MIHSRREFLWSLGKIASVGLTGISCNGNGGGKRNSSPEIIDINRSFKSNTGEVDYFEFFGKSKGRIDSLVTKYNNENLERREITSVDETGKLYSGGIPVGISKEITDRVNILEAVIIDDKNRRSKTVRNAFFIPERNSALENVVGILNREGGYKGFLLDETIRDVPGYGDIKVPILINRIDQGTSSQIGNGQSIIEYVDIGENLSEAFGKRDAIFDNGYSGLFIIRAPMFEVNRLTAELINNRYLSARDADQG